MSCEFKLKFFISSFKLIFLQFALSRNILSEIDDANGGKGRDEMFLCLDKILGANEDLSDSAEDDPDKHDNMFAKIAACSPLFNSAKLF